MSAKPGVDVIEVSLPARAEYIGVARLLISGVANRVGFTYDQIEDMKVSVAEACTNAVQHGYQGADDGTLRIKCEVYADRLVIFVSDSGPSFDMNNKKTKLAPIDKNVEIEHLTEGGLGLYLIHALMDEVEIKEDMGVVVAMTKYLRRDEVAGDGGTFSQP